MSSLQEIMVMHGGKYLKSKKLPFNIHKTLSAIKYCRTSALGGHVYQCDNCGQIKISYSSCRNRHSLNVNLMLKNYGFMKEEKHFFQHIIFM